MLVTEALQKMVQGKFRHLPVVENGEVIALLDIAKCLYDAIARMERAAEKGKAIVAAVEGVEKHWGTSGSVFLCSFVQFFGAVLVQLWCNFCCCFLCSFVHKNRLKPKPKPFETALNRTKRFGFISVLASKLHRTAPQKVSISVVVSLETAPNRTAPTPNYKHLRKRTKSTHLIHSKPITDFIWQGSPNHIPSQGRHKHHRAKPMR
ncbi:uncharacterized protein [Malus domestica]|uniref:uncharacterized protein isoform X2 n=1 Tax=Malus domestica TaxID=3750 RepID=UPI0039756A87